MTCDHPKQEFIKEKSQYTDLLVDAISDWREQNEKVPENISDAGVGHLAGHEKLEELDNRKI